MTVIVCLDDKGGMTFGGKRQSKDKYLRNDILELVGENTLWMNSYTRAQFEEEGDYIVDEDFISRCDSFCFVENISIVENINKISKIIVYRWNRSYPFDMQFDIDLSVGWKKNHTFDFSGYSHEKITKEVYVKNEKN